MEDLILPGEQKVYVIGRVLVGGGWMREGRDNWD